MESSSNFSIYLIGFVIVIVGLAYGAHLAGVPIPWIVVGVVVLVGIGILSAIKRTQSPATPKDEPPRGNPPRY
jgi:uncharacterized membrane protein